MFDWWKPEIESHVPWLAAQPQLSGFVEIHLFMLLRKLLKDDHRHPVKEVEQKKEVPLRSDTLR